MTTAQKPYLMRAIYEWLLDNELTPYMLVETEHEGVQVPRDYIQNGHIVLNIAPDAVRELNMDNEWVTFSARFAGKAMEVFVPIIAVQALYAKENNEGMFFAEDQGDPEPPSDDTPPDNTPPPSPPNGERPTLTVVK